MSVDEEFSEVFQKYFGENEENDDDSFDDVGINYDEELLSLFQAEDQMEVEQIFFTMDLSTIDNKEKDLVNKFISQDCCNKKCQKMIPREIIKNARNNYLELSKHELDLVMLSHIESAIICTDKLGDAYTKTTKWREHERQKGKDVERHKLMFTFYHLPVCRSFFLFVHACGPKRFKNLLRHFHTHGAITRVHALANKPSTHRRAFQPSDIQKAVKFIEYTADLLALPLPGRLPKFKDYRVMKLPSNETKASVYRKYIASLGDDELKMSICSFRRIWAKYIPYVTVMKPANDLCDYCRSK